MVEKAAYAGIRARLQEERASLQSDIDSLENENQAQQDDFGVGVEGAATAVALQPQAPGDAGEVAFGRGVEIEFCRARFGPDGGPAVVEDGPAARDGARAVLVGCTLESVVTALAGDEREGNRVAALDAADGNVVVIALVGRPGPQRQPPRCRVG